MYRYAVKRITRGRSLFLSLFLSVALAATLFSGILQGADAIGAQSIDQIFSSAPYDIISTATDKNITKTNVYNIDPIFQAVPGVEQVDHFERWPVSLVSGSINGTVEGVYLIGIPDDSVFYQGLTVEHLERGVVYVDANSNQADALMEHPNVTLSFETYLWLNPPGFEFRNLTLPLGGTVGVNDKTWALFVDRYAVYLQGLISRNEGASARPIYNLVLVSEDTLKDILTPVFAEQRRPVDDQAGVALITLNRKDLVNPWDIQGSKAKILEIFDHVNSEGVEYFYLPRNFIGEILDLVQNNSNEMKTSTMIVSVPVFFTAWYLGITVSEVVFNQRRREIGLLFTRGMNHRQVLYMLLFEGAMVSILAGAVGIVVSTLILPTVIPGVTPLELIHTISPTTLVASFAFAAALALLSVYRPAQDALKINIVDALREHQTLEEGEGFRWQEPALALLLGGYRIGMQFMGLTVDMFRPASSNLIINLVYSTWWGTDYLLGFIAPILFFWGFTTLFVQYAPWYQGFLTRVAKLVGGDSARFATLSSRRNLKRVAASAFMAALIVGYSVTVIGNIATSDDYLTSAVKTSVGADAAVWLFEGKNADEVMEKILSLPGVQSATVETIFIPTTSLGDVPVRAIDPLVWRDTAYIGPEFVDDLSVFETMNNTADSGILERGAARALGLQVGNTFVVKVASNTYPVKIVGFFGREPGENWVPSNPVLYVNDGFLSHVKERYIDQRRIILKLSDDADVSTLKTSMETIDTDVQRVDMMQLNLRAALTNVLLAGPKQIQTLGAYFAGLVASLGILLVTITVITSRNKELTIMAIRGFSRRQIVAGLLVESLGMDLFAVIIGLFVGVASIIGIVDLLNQTLPFIFSHRVIFPLNSQVQLGGIIILLLVSTVAPVLVAARRITENPDLKLEE